MKHSNKIKLTIFFLTLLSHASFAQSNFNGVNAAVGVGFSNLTTDANFDSYGTYKQGQAGVLGTAQVGVSYAFYKQFNIASTVFYNFGSQSAGYYTNNNEQYTVKNIWGISIEPGYTFLDSILAYLKLGYAQASSSYAETGYATAQYGTSNGFLYGLGFKHLITDNIFIGVEAYRVSFSREDSTWNGAPSSNAPGLTYAGALIGWTF